MTTPEIQPEATSPLELFLLQLRYREGRSIDVENNTSILLDDPGLVWVVYSGQVDVFSVPVSGGQVIGARRHLFRVGGGHLLFGIQSDEGSLFKFLASGTPGTCLIQIDRGHFQEIVSDPESRKFMAKMVDDWVQALSSCSAISVPPKELSLLTPGPEFELGASEACAAKRDLVWAKVDQGNLEFLDRSELGCKDCQSYLPLSRFMWARPVQPVLLSTMDTLTFFEHDPDWNGLTEFHGLVLKALSLRFQEKLSADQTRFEKRAVAEQLALRGALEQLRSPLEGGEAAVFTSTVIDRDSALMAACNLVGDSMGVSVSKPPDLEKMSSEHAMLTRVAKASSLRIRLVRLHEGWYSHTLGPLVGFLDGDESDQPGRPVALLPAGEGSYACHDPVTLERVTIGPEEAAQLASTAYVFYRPLPPGKLTGRSLLKFAFSDVTTDLRSIMLFGLAMGILNLFPPLATGAIFNRLIPGAQRPELLQVGIGLILFAIALGIFHYAREISTVRLEGKVDYALQAAIWDRLLSLPSPFFRAFTAGDLGSRAMSLAMIRQMLSGPVIAAVFDGLFAIPVLVLLFFYSFKLGILAIGLVAVGVLGTACVAYAQLRYQRALAEIQGHVSGLVLQLITGIAKFRVAGSEHRAFSLWAESFASQKRLYYKVRRLANGYMAFNAAFPVWAALIIFLMVAISKDAPISTGDFLAFNLAFTQFVGAGIIMSVTLLAVTNVLPLYEQAKPILETLPEADETKADPGELSGKIEVSRVSFRYEEGSTLVLKDVSLTVEPGEFVAIVGASGSGKSTLFRLLIGFEQPESGGVFYDGGDLSELDLRAVRQQLGVVLQNAQPMMGDIFTNIVGSFPHLTQDDAWDAARLVGLEKDIKAMPMGMHTIVTHGGGTFSGGQIQRLLIARALANKSRILFLDEATSALDNQTQAHVSESLSGIAATRVVIAHRLSTIEEADRIYVFDAGRIVQQGTYTELLRQRGPFAELAKRQMA